VIVVAWDMPFVPAELLEALAAGLSQADACLPESSGPRGLEPMCAGYGPGCQAAIEASLAEGDLRATSFHSRIKLSILSSEQVSRLGDPALMFFNVNTSADLAEANQLWQRHGSSR
jgi:molybdopterin-guanine dinucleotide biosynthesis protein A